METPEEGDEVKVIDFGKWRAFKMKLEDHQWVRLKTVNREMKWTPSQGQFFL